LSRSSGLWCHQLAPHPLGRLIAPCHSRSLFRRIDQFLTDERLVGRHLPMGSVGDHPGGRQAHRALQSGRHRFRRVATTREYPFQVGSVSPRVGGSGDSEGDVLHLVRGGHHGYSGLLRRIRASWTSLLASNSVSTFNCLLGIRSVDESRSHAQRDRFTARQASR
jgi:hypothetical protein